MGHARDPEAPGSSPAPVASPRGDRARRALQLVLLLGVVSFFADATYEGWRSVSGPFLLSLGAGAFVVGLVTGLGELTTYLLRPLSGRLTDRLGRPWAVAVPGYLVNLLVVPAMALAGSWPVAAALWIGERAGKGIRNPPRDLLLSYAGRHVGAGWAFGLHEGLDQAGAVAGPIAITLVLFLGGSYRTGFAALGLAAVASLTVLAVAIRRFPTPADLEPAAAAAPVVVAGRFRTFLVASGFLAAGLVGFPIVAFFFLSHGTVSAPAVPLLYAVGMAVQGVSGLALGRLYERIGARSVLFGAVLALGSAPLLFSPGLATEALGMVLWGIGMGAQESSLTAVIALSVPSASRASAFGELQAALGVGGFGSGVVLGALLGVSIPAVVLAAVGFGAVGAALFGLALAAPRSSEVRAG